VFSYRASPPGAEVAFTDGDPDLRVLRPGLGSALRAVEAACGVRSARVQQVHGDVVHAADRPTEDVEETSVAGLPEADGLVTTTRGLALVVRAADCVPVLLADPGAGVVGAAHAGRRGTELGVVTRVVEAMVARGADPRATTAWIGPHVCGSCYEVPARLRDQVARAVPETWASTRVDTPALDLAAGVRAQLDRAGVTAVVEAGPCTVEDERLPSHRRDGESAARLAGLVWLP